MASSSRPFQSQTVSRLLTGYRQIAHGAERWLRQAETALLWGVQVVAFPLYVAVQSVRSAARTLQATKPWQSVAALLTGDPPQPTPLSADAPIQALLSLTQPLAATQPGPLRFGDPRRDLLCQSRADRVIVKGDGPMVPLANRVVGVASDLATRNLVLVTANNVIFNDLTDLQRHQLQRAMTLLMAEYASWCRRRWQDRQLQSPGLPLPHASENQWFPVRWINQALAWMQVSPLAQVTNLFGEAQPWRPAEWSAENQALGGGWHRSLAGQGRLALQAPPRLGAALATRPQTTGGIVTYFAEDGTVMVADTLGATSLDQAPLGQKGEAHETPDPWERTVSGWGNGKALPENDAIEAQVALVTYVDHPLVVVLRWLDALLHQAETWLQQTWRWLRGQA